MRTTVVFICLYFLSFLVKAQSDTLIVRNKCAVLATPGIGKALVEDDYHDEADRWMYYDQISDSVFVANHLPYFFLQVRYATFVQRNGKRTTIDTDSLEAKQWVLYFFDGIRQPYQADFFDVANEYERYFGTGKGLDVLLEGRNAITPSIHFKNGSAEMNAESSIFLDSLTQFLNLHDNLVIEVQSYFDFHGPDSLRLKLRRARDQEICAGLYSRGIPHDRVYPCGTDCSEEWPGAISNAQKFTPKELKGLPKIKQLVVIRIISMEYKRQ